MSDHPTVGTFNFLEASIGARGMGKSTYQCARARELQSQAGGAYVIGHSLGARLPAGLPAELGGGELPIVYHTTLAKLERGIRNSPDKWHILAPPLAGDGHRIDASKPVETADDLIHFCVRLSTQLRKRAWQQRYPWKWWTPNVNYTGVSCPPIILIIDEGIAIEAASTTKKESNKWFLQFIYSIRHLHIALLYAIQNSNARSWQIIEQSTSIHVFAIKHEWALNSLRAAGATEEELDRIRTQGPYQHVTLRSLDAQKMEESSKNKIPE